MGLLAEVYTSELGAVYMEDPSWFAWHNSTVPTKEREIDGIWFGNRHTTPERSRPRKGERQRHENIATSQSAWRGHPQKPPALAKGHWWKPSPLHPSPAHQTRINSFHMGLE